MKLLNKIIVIIFLFVIYIYVCYFSYLPENYIVIQGEEFKMPKLFGIKILNEYENENEYNSLETSSNLGENKLNNIGRNKVSVNLFDKLKIKNCNINVIPKTRVIPIGKAIGMKLYTDGVLVVGMSEIEGEKPYINSGIKEGDRIVEIDKTKIRNTDDLVNKVNASNGKEIEVKYIRNEEECFSYIKPVQSKKNEYRLGLWVRDAAAGVGTLTFYEPSTNSFATLGHGILDIDTSNLIKISNGELVTTNILKIKKGEKGRPGEIRGTIENGSTIGKISKNTNFGVFGQLTNKKISGINNLNEMDVCYRNEIKKGNAEIICELENGKQEKYNIEIKKIFLNNNENNKSMLIKITDERLLNKTGGIIQGMSGAPIIQEGKFVGAVTNVLVNDPSMGYGVFADIMLKQMRKIE